MGHIQDLCNQGRRAGGSNGVVSGSVFNVSALLYNTVVGGGSVLYIR